MCEDTLWRVTAFSNEVVYVMAQHADSAAKKARDEMNKRWRADFEAQGEQWDEGCEFRVRAVDFIADAEHLVA